jgi:anti-sigma B factor antagonist
MNLVPRTHADTLIVTVDAPRIDAAGAVRFKDEMRRLTEGWTGRVVLDLERVDFLDSSGLGALVSSMKALGDQRQLELAALAPSVGKVIRLTRMDSVFPIHASAGAAVGEQARAS